MQTQPDPAPNENQLIIQALAEQNKWLKKLNEKFALFLILLVISWVVTLLF